MDNNMNFIESLIGRPCLHITVRGDKMHLRVPESEITTFSDYHLFWMKDDPEYPSDWGIETGIVEYEKQIVVSFTDGMCEPENHIFIFDK